MAQYICSFIKKCLFCFFTNNNEQYEPVHSFRNDDYEVEKLLSGSEAPSVHWLANKSVAKKSSILEMTPIDDSFNASNFSNFSDSSSSSEDDDEDLFFSCMEETSENNLEKSIDFFNSTIGSHVIDNSGFI